MDSTDDEPERIVLDEHDTAAVVAILIRAVRMQDQIKADTDLIEEANERLAAAKLASSRGVAALGLFGFEPVGGKVWENVRRSIGDEAYERAVLIARGIQVPELLAAMNNENEADNSGDSRRTDGSERSASIMPGGGEDSRSTHHPPPRIRDAIIDYLRSVRGDGAKVAEIKQHLLSTYGIETHQKTPGMTLFRLQKQGLVRREGRVWFLDVAGDEAAEHAIGDATPARRSEQAIDAEPEDSAIDQ
jgi:hypothetical protein